MKYNITYVVQCERTFSYRMQSRQRYITIFICEIVIEKLVSSVHQSGGWKIVLLRNCMETVEISR